MDKHRVLFLCVRNSARSQLAEALLRDIAPERFEAMSGGLEPSELMPEVPVVLSEIGVDASGLRSKGIDEFLGKLHVQTLITVCDMAEEGCPRVWPGVNERLYWPVEDPDIDADAETRLAAFRSARDVLRERIAFWIAGQDA